MTTINFKALISRINRKLKPNFECLRKNRSPKYWNDLGDYYLQDFNRNLIIACHVDPEKLGREIGVLTPSERVRPDDMEHRHGQ